MRLATFAVAFAAVSRAGAAPPVRAPSKAPAASPPQPGPSETEIEARAALKRGLAAFARRDAQAALLEYKRAQELVPDANLPYRYAAEALVELERYEEAIAEYEKYLAIKPDVSDADDVKKRIEEARARTTGTVAITSSPAGADVFVDGAPAKAGTTPLAGLQLRRGPHTIVVRLAGRKDIVLTPTVRGGSDLALACDFAEPAAARSRPEPAPEPPRRSPPILGWALLGAGAGIAAGSFVVDAFVLRPKIDDFDRERNAGDASAAETKKSIATMQTVLLVGYGVGAVSMIAGGALLLWPRSSPPAPTSRVVVFPHVALAGAGVTVTGTFDPL